MMTVVATAVQGFEERYTFYRNIFLYCGIAALVFLAIAIILFFVLKIPQVFGELTGRTARKAVEEMASGGTPTVKKKTDKKYKGKKETKKPATGTAPKKQVYSDLIGENDTPVRLVTHDDIPTPTLMPRREEETSILSEGETEVLGVGITETETEVLGTGMTEGETEVLGGSQRMTGTESETTVPGAVEAETDILQMPETQVTPEEADFVVVRSIVEIHTDEVIER